MTAVPKPSSSDPVAAPQLTGDALLRAALTGRDTPAKARTTGKARKAKAVHGGLEQALPPLTPSGPTDQLWTVLEEKLAARARARSTALPPEGIMARLVAPVRRMFGHSPRG